MRRRLSLLPLIAILLVATFAPLSAMAHALQPGYLEMRPLGANQWSVLWRVPDVQGRAMQIYAVLPETCEPGRSPETRPEAGAWVARWVAVCPDGLEGGSITIEGLSRTRTDVLVRYGLGENAGEGAGTVDQTLRLTPDVIGAEIPERQGPLAVATDYAMLGIVHILLGIDHLLFVAGLMLLIRDRRRLIWAVTSFTVAHSITLAAAALGWLFIPMPPVEAVIALSIAFLASEAMRGGPGKALRYSERNPWIVAFGFGLLHGLGFGSALMEIGLPQDAVPLALVSFNVGVEIGQLLFIAVVLLALFVLKRIPGLGSAAPIARVATCYAIGCLAMFWTFERVVAFTA